MKPKGAPGHQIRLSAREADILRLIAGGHTYAQAAMRLGISPHTVAAHVKKVYRKLGVHSAGAAVGRAFELGLLSRAST